MTSSITFSRERERRVLVVYVFCWGRVVFPAWLRAWLPPRLPPRLPVYRIEQCITLLAILCFPCRREHNFSPEWYSRCSVSNISDLPDLPRPPQTPWPFCASRAGESTTFHQNDAPVQARAPFQTSPDLPRPPQALPRSPPAPSDLPRPSPDGERGVGGRSRVRALCFPRA